MPFGGLLTASLIAGGGSIIGSTVGASASKDAASQQVQEQQQALQFQQQEWAQQQADLAPYIQGGQQTFGQLVNDLQNGTFGPGSLGPAPTFTAPTGVTMQNDPGYQFQLDQGDLGIERGAAAAGGAFTGGTLKSLAGYNQEMGNSAYQSVFNNALAGYGTALSSYQSNLATQAQGFNQLASVAGIGQTANNTEAGAGANASSAIGATFGNIGAAQAAGTIGAANSITGGILNSTTLPLYMQQYMQQQQQYQNNNGYSQTGLSPAQMQSLPPLTGVPVIDPISGDEVG